MAGTFEDFLNEQDTAAQPDRAAILRASQVSPDDAAEAQRLAPSAGLSVELVQRNLPEVKAKQDQSNLETFLKDTPELGNLGRSDQFLSVARDQIEEMSALKQTGVNLRASVNRVTGGAITSLSDLMDTTLPDWLQVGFVRSEDGKWKFAKGEEYRSKALVRPEVGMGIIESAERELQPLAPWSDVQQADGVLPTIGAGAAFAAEQGVLSVPEMFAAYFAPYALGASYTGQIEASRAETRATQTGGPAEITGADRGIGALAAIPISLLNKFGADKVLGVVQALNSTAARRIVTAGVAEGVTEVTQDQVQYIAEKTGLAPFDVHEMVASIPPAFLGGSVGGAGLRGGVEIVNSTVGSLARRVNGAQEANQAGETLDELTSLAEASKLRERSPEQFAKYINAITPNADLYVSAQDLQDSLSQSEIDDLPPEMQDRIMESAEAATPVRFTVAEYATYLSGAAKKLNPKVRVGSADAVSFEEAQNIESEFSERAKAAVAIAQDADALAAEGEEIRQQVQAQVVSTGRFRSDVADAYGALIRDFFVAQSAVAGVSPAELFRQYPLRIQADAIAGEPALDQPLNEAALQPVARIVEDGAPGEAPRGFTRFRRFATKRTPTIDPAFMGTGALGSIGTAAERRRGGMKVTSLYPDTGFKKEQGLGNIEYVVDIPTSKLYDADADPLNLRVKASDFASFDADGNGIGEPVLDASEYERLIRDAGFMGYVRPKAEGNLKGQARVFDVVPVTGAPQDASLKIPRAQKLSPEDRAIETRFADWLANNFEEAVRQYSAIKTPDTSDGGRVLNTDIARELSPDYRADRSRSQAVHEPASWFIGELYKRKLAEAKKGSKILFTAGGTGAGKSTALKGLDMSQFAIIYDTNIARASSGKSKIDQALEAGMKVDVAYVFRDPVEAFRGATGRAQRMAAKYGTGRTVPVSAHVASHAGSRHAIPELMATYADEPNVNFTTVKSGEGPVPIAELPELDYNRVREDTVNELERQRAQGTISDAEYRAFKGEGSGEGAAQSGTRTDDLGGVDESAEGQRSSERLSGYFSADPQTFSEALESARSAMSARDRGQVSPLPAGFAGQLYLSSDQMTGFAVATDGELAHVFKRPGAPAGFMDTALQLGKQRGATHLWAFENLAKSYAKRGAVETERLPFDPSLAPEGWNVETMGTPAVVRMDLANVGELAQTKRGKITLGRDMAASPAVITLLQNADLSTFLHESGHFFLEVLTDLAARSGAPAQFVQDSQVLFDWLGFKGTAAQWRTTPVDQRRAQHEQFARGFEAWLLEGKAPGPDQRRLFQRFRAWLINVYRSLAQLNVTLTDEVRSVMGRMLATQNQIKAAEAQRSLAPLFTDQASSGMTPEEWQTYQNVARDATENAQDQLQTRSLRNVRWLANAKSRELRKLQKENEAKRNAVKEEVENEIAQRPERVAETLLNTGEAYLTNPQGGEPVKIKLEGNHKLSTDKLAEDFGSTEDYRAVAEAAGGVDVSNVRAPWHGLPRNFVAKDGMSADAVAELVGFTSGDQLVRTLIAMPSRERLVEQMTDARVLQRYGDLNNETEMNRAVDIALHNQMRTRMVATELAALEGATNVRAGRRDLLRRAAREFAERVVNRKKVRDLRPGQFAAAEAMAARDSAAALAKGDSRLAAVRKRDQLFNGYASRAASRAQENIEKGLRHLLTFQNDSTRKNLDPSYRDQIDKLLERFDLKARTLRQIDNRAALANWIEEQREQGNEPAIPAELMDEAQRTHYRNLTVEQFQGLVDAVKNIEHLARLKNRLLKNARERDFKKAKDELIASIEANHPTVRDEKFEKDVSAWARAGELVSEWFTSLRKLASVVRVIDGGKDGGRAWDYFVAPLNAAADRELLMRREATAKLNELLDMIPGINSIERAKRKIVGASKRFIPEIQRSLSLDARLAVALNAGNDGNVQRLMEGNQWTRAQIQAIINTLSKTEMDFVQASLDYIGSFWSEIRAKEERVTGVAPDGVQPTPIQTPHGVYKGGYYPIVADPMRSDKAAQQNDAELIAQSLRGAITRATTRRGHTKERVGGKDPIRLDLGVLAQHVSQVTHDLAWHETLIDFNKMLRDRDVSSTLRERYGPEITKMMRRVADDVARGDVEARTSSERILNYLRTGSTVAGLGFNAVTSLLQLTGFTQSIVRVGHIPMYKAIARYTANPVRATKFAQDKSEFMRSRSLARNRELGEVFNRLDGQKHTLAGIAFWPIQALQTVVDVPTWHATYNKALEAGETDERAVALADQGVRDAQGSGVTHDLAEVQRSGPLMKLLTNFYSYFNTTYNLAVESAGTVRREKSAASVLKMGADYLLLFTIPTVFTQFVIAAIRGDDEDKTVVEKLVKGHASSALNMFPIIREFTGVIEGFDYSGPAGLSFFSDASKLIQQASQGEVDEALLRAANRTAGQVLHYPATQVDRTVRGMVAVSEGDAGPQAILLGPPKE